ncbi:MAG: exo-alpha-sialidase, partial [Pirellula sp.]
PKKLQDGKLQPIYLFYKVGPSPETWWGMEICSFEQGKTWTKPLRLKEGFLGPIKNKPIELENGDWLCPTSSETEEEPSKWQVYFERFEYESRKWTKTPLLNDGVEIQAIQPTILRLGSGRVKAIGRSRQNKIFETLSDDEGKTWTPLSLGTLPNNNSGLDAL